MNRPTIPSAHLVLVGGGHSHVQTLRRLMMRPADRASLRVTMIAREVDTPYSGMLPGRVAGFYGNEEMHIDLARLCRAADVRLVLDEVIELDASAQTVSASQHPRFGYDLLSINSGACPGVADVELETSIVPVKPIGQFLLLWEGIRDEVQRAISQDKSRSLVVVGAGAGGVELSLAIAKSLQESVGGGVSLHLVESSEEILPGHNSRVQRWAEKQLTRSGVSILKGFQVSLATGEGIVSRTGEKLPADHVLWTTGVSAPGFLENSGLALDSQGFVRVNQYLQSVSHDSVFAAGDVADLVDQPRPKSGVYAVRAGPALTENLLRYARGAPLKPYRAQTRALALIGDSQESAVASRGSFFAAGKPIFALKQFIDRRFMRRFEVTPMQKNTDDPNAKDSRMRCAGCGAKLPASLLNRVLHRLDVPMHAEVLQGIGDDAALLRLDPQTLAVTTDHFPQMVGDTYRFGRIAAHHALSDLFAMGAQARYALLNISLELASEALMEEEMYLLLKGVTEVFFEEGVALVGGHSTEAEQTQLGCTVFGALEDHALSKGELAPGDRLVLTKPLGIGVILAGDMRSATLGRWLETTLQTMDQSNAAAARLVRAHGAQSCTDVTGFGLLGHLSEMLRASGCTAELEMSAVPLIEGATQLMDEGIQSSLQEGNEGVMADVELDGLLPSDARFRILMDPQTSGGLLAGIGADEADRLVAELHRAGYAESAVIGRVKSGDSGLIRVS